MIVEEKLTRLINYTTGDATEMTKNCIQVPDKIGFDIAKRFLIKRYSDPYRIITTERMETKDQPQMKANDTDTYQKFQNFLVKLENIGHLQSWNLLDTPDIVCMLLLKLNDRVKSSKNNLDIRRKPKREPDLTDFIYFLIDETLIVSDTVFSKGMMVKYMLKRNKHLLVAFTLVKITYWIGAMHPYSKH